MYETLSKKAFDDAEFDGNDIFDQNFLRKADFGQCGPGSLFVQYSDTQLQDLVTVTVTVFRILTLVTVKSVLQDLQ